MLRAEGLSVRYGPGCPACAAGLDGSACRACGSMWAIRDVSLDVEAGEVLGIVGESGSGKSTTLACLHLDLVPASGRVWLLGRDVTGVTGTARRRLRAETLGIVYQSADRSLELGVTAGGNVAARLFAAGWRSYGESRLRASELHAGMELPEERLDEPVERYSGGMRQRVQLARALATRPALLLLDEPTSGLDVSVQARILDLVRRVHRETGVAVVVVSHDLGVIRTLADRLLVMRHGRVVERGLTDQVLGDPQHPYSQLLVGSQL
ncbi:MAG TPA: ATP-binding cassette domain-containing protein [Candidatus Dormibacteraeota bacterium]